METAVKTKWNLDIAHSEISFKVKHMMITSVTGHFADFNASTETMGDDFKDAHFSFVAAVDSINTKNKDRDTHLKSDDFFSAKNFQEISFESNSFDGNTLIGDLTIRDVTRSIELEADFNGIVIDPYNQVKAGMELEGTINRKDFGLQWNTVTEAGSVVVADKVKLVVSLQFIKS